MFQKNNENKLNSTHGHSPVKHLLHMVICCGLPALIILSLPFISKFSPSLSGILGYIAPFICPIMMGGMMIAMFRNKDAGCCKEEKVIDSELKEREK